MFSLVKILNYQPYKCIKLWKAMLGEFLATWQIQVMDKCSYPIKTNRNAREIITVKEEA